MSLKDHRLNQLQDCALIMLYHLEDIAEYLSERVSKHQQCLSILDRSFVEMEILKPAIR